MDSPNTTAEAVEIDYRSMSAGEFLQAVGMDAKKWADAFEQINPPTDHGTMIGWFANAIMAGFDEAERRTRAANASRTPHMPVPQLKPEGQRTKYEELEACYAMLFNQLCEMTRENFRLRAELESTPPAKATDATESCNGQRLIDWLDNPRRKPAHLSFTDGLERQIAYRFEMPKGRNTPAKATDAGEVSDFDAEVAIAEALDLMPPDTTREEKGVPVLKYLHSLGYRIVRDTEKEGGAL